MSAERWSRRRSGGHRVARERRLGFLVEDVRTARRVGSRSISSAAQNLRAHEVVPDVRHDQSHRGEHAGLRRHQHRRNARRSGRAPPRAGVLRPRRRAARCRGGRSPSPAELTRTARSMFALAMRMMPAAAASTDMPRRLGDPLGARPSAPPPLSTSIAPPRNRSGCRPAQHDVGVRDGRLGAAPSVRGGAGVRTRAVRSDVQAVAIVEPRGCCRRRRRWC